MLALLTTPAYQRAITIVPIIILAYFVRSFGDFFRFVFLALGRPLYDAACNWITAAAALTGYALLIPRYGIDGAAWATLITFLVAAVLSMIWVYRVWPYEIETVRLAKVFSVTGAVESTAPKKLSAAPLSSAAKYTVRSRNVVSAR